ncbi:MAG: hypothetical protein E7K72_00865 [Roseomonas mucosa]|nr:hypothetical protein [Roseomonas mucosa]
MGRQAGGDEAANDALDKLTPLEAAALRSILEEAPEHESALARQVAAAEVIHRTNTGAGFLTELSVPAEVPPAAASGVLGRNTQARVEGLQFGLGFVLFLEDGRITALEGHAWGPESTDALDLHDLDFTVFRAPVRQVG